MPTMQTLQVPWTFFGLLQRIYFYAFGIWIESPTSPTTSRQGSDMQLLRGEPFPDLGYDDRQDHEMRELIECLKASVKAGRISEDEARRALFDADVPASVCGRVLR